MSAHAYSEDQLVEQPAIGLFAELGWQVAGPPPTACVAGEPRDAGLLGRETKGEVVLVPRLRAALERLNPTRLPKAIAAAIDELTRDRLAMLLEQANREVYRLLKEGIPVSIADNGVSTTHPGPLPGRSGEGANRAGNHRGEGRGGQTTVRVRVIDWEQPANNDFLLVSQFSVTGALYTCRPDLVGFVNGLPLVVIELKKPGVPARAAFDENLTHYKAEIPQLFWFNALLIASNGTDSRVGSLTADWERFFEWKRIEREDEPRRVSLEVMIRGTCDKARLLDLVENFTLFSEHKAGLVKIIGQNHQFLGVNNAIASMLEARKRGHGRGGVFWQTQGSGKSFSMEKALAIYGTGKGGERPVRNKSMLVGDLRKAVEDATSFCASRQVILPAIEQLPAGGMERLQSVDDAVNALISPDPLRREFLDHQRLVSTLYSAVKPDLAALEFAGRVACLAVIADAIRSKLNPNPTDITAIMGEINEVLDESIAGIAIKEEGPPALDLSKINFGALAKRFKESKHKNTSLEVLKATIRAMLERLIRLNNTRADFAERFEEMIESYNAGSRSIEELFQELLELSRTLSEEEQRHIRENMTEEELVLFDILTRPAPELSAEERAEVKKVARELLNRLKSLLVLNWRQKSSARSQLKLAIEDVLDSGLPRIYDKPLYEQKCSALFEHVYESYPERESSVYGLST